LAKYYSQRLQYEVLKVLTVGTKRTDKFTVEGVLTTDVHGTFPYTVLSTPGMIGMMEMTAALSVAEDLGSDKASVGFEVSIKHVAGCMEGSECEASSELVEIVDERKLRFKVKVVDLADGRVLGLGTHERRVVSLPSSE